jgi:hypothetical protein
VSELVVNLSEYVSFCSSLRSFDKGGETVSDWTGRTRTQLLGEKLGEVYVEILLSIG